LSIPTSQCPPKNNIFKEGEKTAQIPDALQAAPNVYKL
jgi:hypothetical protein